MDKLPCSDSRHLPPAHYVPPSTGFVWKCPACGAETVFPSASSWGSGSMRLSAACIVERHVWVAQCQQKDVTAQGSAIAKALHQVCTFYDAAGAVAVSMAAKNGQVLQLPGKSSGGMK
jgi:alpha-D-ribose 1-methylphosphonate 5-phosphate C-P lyase